MTKTQRRVHLTVWLVLGPVLLAAAVVAMRTRAASQADRSAEVAR